ncbi:MAG: hypothetical protein AB7H43_06860 [Acidimicrobiia bacterium]
MIVVEPTSADILPGRGGWRRRWVVLGAVAAAAAVVAVALLMTRSGDGHPSAWDPRVADLVDFVEDERDLDFDHPVHVDFLSDEDFEDLVRADEADLTEEERADIEDGAAVLRALGLLGRDVDLFAAVNDLQGDGTLAFYDDTDERVRVRGTELTPALRSTLVHELVHALQDQHFDLSRLREMEDGESAAFDALVEGDASRVATAYEETLSDEEREQIVEAEGRDQEELDVDRFPPFLSASFGLPYVLGEPLVSIILEADGREGLDRAFREPPSSDAALLDPLGFLEDDGTEEVDAQDLGEGETEIDSGEFGAVGLYLVLAHHLDVPRALSAASGWGGDSYLAYRSGDRVCVRATFVGDEPVDTDALRSALRDWAAAMPAGWATVGDDGSAVTLTSCETDADASPGDDVDVERLMVLPASRSALAAQLLAQGAPVEVAHCFTDRIILEFTLDELVASALTPEASARLERLAASCRDA